MRPITKITPNTPITNELLIESNIKGTYYYLIPDHKKPRWKNLLSKHERGEALTESEFKFIKEMNSYTCKINDRIKRREEAKRIQRTPYIVGFSERWI